MKWIELKYQNEIPPKFKDILVVIEFTNAVTILQATGDGWLEPVTGQKMRVSVTHWMPLPEPPTK